MIITFENRCVLKNYVIVLRPISNTMYKGKKRSKYTCEIYITNWSYSYKVGIVFAMYQIMRSKGTSWAGPRPKYLPCHNNISHPLILPYRNYQGHGQCPPSHTQAFTSKTLPCCQTYSLKWPCIFPGQFLHHKLYQLVSTLN